MHYQGKTLNCFVFSQHGQSVEIQVNIEERRCYTWNSFAKTCFFSSKWNMPAVKMICLAVDFPSVPRNTSPNGGLFLVLLLLDVSNTVNGFKIPQCQSRWLASRVLISLSLLLNHPFWEKQVFNPGEQYYINQWWAHCITDRQIVSKTIVSNFAHVRVSLVLFDLMIFLVGICYLSPPHLHC